MKYNKIMVKFFCCKFLDLFILFIFLFFDYCWQKFVDIFCMEKLFIFVELFLKIFYGFYDICDGNFLMQKVFLGYNQEFIVFVCCDVEFIEEVVIIIKYGKNLYMFFSRKD